MQADELSLFSDDESVGSIFSSSDEEEEDMMAPTPIPQELDSEFKRRDELMDQLVKDIEPKYALAMKKIEQAVRNKRIDRFNQIDISGTKLDDKIARTSISTHSSSSTRPRESRFCLQSHWMDGKSRVLASPRNDIQAARTNDSTAELRCLQCRYARKSVAFYKFHAYSRVFHSHFAYHR